MNKENIVIKLKEIHSNDQQQIGFILAEDKRIIVTASAGCGKTKAMISKIAYEIVAMDKINYKKILALTFSVNAATKIKEDTMTILPDLLGEDTVDIDRKLDISNYHSFSTKMLLKHGYFLNENLSNIDKFTIVADDLKSLNRFLSIREIAILEQFSKAINQVNIEAINYLEEAYINIVLEKLVPHEVMTYNGLLILARKLLRTQAISNFYKCYYPLIIIDEFQDTNYLSYKLITSLIGENNRIILMGDDIQRIYGFLGAIPNIFKDMEKEYDMTSMEFQKNYRFKDNEKMRELDSYIREIFRKYDSMQSFDKSAEINLGFYDTNSKERDAIVKSMKLKIEQNSTVALLVNRKRSAESVMKKLESKGLKYFNGLFKDTDDEYIRFHKIAVEIFIRESGISKSTSKRVIDEVVEEIKVQESAITEDKVLFNSLMVLLEALFESVKASNINSGDRYREITFVLEGKSLKRLMNEIDADIVLTTIHSSKGLEWDYVYIPEVTESEFPFFYALCQECKDSGSNIQDDYHCKFTFPEQLRSRFEEQLSLFYVGITRARKDVFLFANVDKNRNGYYKKRSCLTTLPNLTINRDFE